jgi:SAM-dependent methyltransferase
MTANAPQNEHWNGAESDHWVTHADRYDRQLQPFAAALLERLAITAGERVLDVGCGCGVTTIAAADAGASRAVGLDLSRPMLAVARRRADESGKRNVEFVEGDAQTHPFAPESSDVVLSRFGVMFFDDPVAAFTNLHAALAPGGRLGFVCWQPLDANAWLLVPGLAAAAYVPLPDLGGGDGPGVFSLASPETIRTLLTDAGFAGVEIEACTPTITLGGGGTLAETVEFLLGTGIARALLDSAPPDARGRAIDAVTDALASHYEADHGVRLGSAAWLVSATG